MTAETIANGRRQTPAEILEAGLARHFGRPVAIAQIESRPHDGFSSHPIDHLWVTLADGRRLAVIFKRLQPGNDADVRREWEVVLYERLLRGGRFGAPNLYASLFDEAGGRYWLFLEDIGDWRLEYGEAEDWEAAFRWLAKLHGIWYGREEELAATGLVWHAVPFYRNLAEAARESLSLRGEPAALERFDGLMGRFAERVAELDRQPRTLLHGDVSCHNLVIAADGRIRPVDWEWAAIGPPAWDLTRLLAGWGREKPRFLEIYREAFDQVAVRRLDRWAFDRSLALGDVLAALWYLRWWTRPCRDPAFVARLLTKIERTWERLDQEGDDG